MVKLIKNKLLTKSCIYLYFKQSEAITHNFRRFYEISISEEVTEQKGITNPLILIFVGILFLRKSNVPKLTLSGVGGEERGDQHFRNLVHFSKKPGESPRIPKDSGRIPQKPENPHDLDSTESSRIPWNPQESSETPRNFWESQGILKNPENPQKVSPNIFGNLVQNF